MARGGFGIYYSRIDGHIGYINDLLGETQQINQVFIPLTGIGGLQSPLTGQPLTSAEIYRTLQARGVLGQRAILPEDLAPHGIVPGPGTAPPGEGMFTGVAVELDASNRIFTTLPVLPVQR